MSQKKPVVALGMSGGVDSSVAVHLLQQAGYEVHGIHMLMIPEKFQPNSGAVSDAKTVADLDGKAATIKVVYAAENGASQKTLAYKITFDVAQAAPVSTQDVTAPAEEVTEETVTEVEA